MDKLREQGYRPDGIILEEHEARKLLKINFNAELDDDMPLPSRIELFGLPVKIQR